MKWSIGRVLAAIFGLALVALLMITALSFNSSRALLDSRELGRLSNAVIAETSAIRSSITEAETNRWFGEAEGLKVSLAGARDKLAQMDQITTRRDTAINLGIPTFTEAAGRATDPPRPGQTP